MYHLFNRNFQNCVQSRILLVICYIMIRGPLFVLFDLFVLFICLCFVSEAMILSVLLWFTFTCYSFGILKLFWCQNTHVIELDVNIYHKQLNQNFTIAIAMTYMYSGVATIRHFRHVPTHNFSPFFFNYVCFMFIVLMTSFHKLKDKHLQWVLWNWQYSLKLTVHFIFKGFVLT